MTSRHHIGAFLGLAVIAWIILLWIRGTPIGWDHLWPYGLVVSLLTLLAAAFDRWIWAWRALNGWFVHRPDIRGTWQVELKSQWIDPDIGEPPDPIVCYMAIRQTLSRLSMRLMTRESSSSLIADRIVRSNDGVCHVTGVYSNTPNLELRGEQSEIHFGALMLQVIDDPPTSLQGHYWTDRNSRGTMVFSRRFDKVYSCYEDARIANSIE